MKKFCKFFLADFLSLFPDFLPLIQENYCEMNEIVLKRQTMTRLKSDNWVSEGVHRNIMDLELIFYVQTFSKFGDYIFSKVTMADILS